MQRDWRYVSRVVSNGLGGGEFQVPPVRYVVNGHLPTSPLAELSADLIKG